MAFNVVETTVADIHAAYKAGTLTARQLVQTYLDRIAAYDKKGPAINSHHLAQSQRRWRKPIGSMPRSRPRASSVRCTAFPVIMKDQADIEGMPTTLGSVLFKDYMPDRDCFVVAKLKKAGVIFLGKATLGELGGGDTHGSLFGSTRNVYDLERTAGGSSGGSGASVSANFCAVAVGQEGFASIRRPSIWNGVVGMRPTMGLVSRGGVYGGWPTINGSLGPMARTVTDAGEAARQHGRLRSRRSGDRLRRRQHGGQLFGDARQGRAEGRAHRHSARDDGLCGRARQATISSRSAKCSTGRLPICAKAGAEIVDPIVIPDLKALIAKRARSVEDDDRCSSCSSRAARRRSRPARTPWPRRCSRRWPTAPASAGPARLRRRSITLICKARDTLMINMLKVMADHRLDAIVHKAVEHQPTLIKDGVNPPFVDQKGAPHINTFLMFVPSIVVPAGFTRSQLAGRDYVSRPALRRRQDDPARLCLRAGEPASARAGHHAVVRNRTVGRGDRKPFRPRLLWCFVIEGAHSVSDTTAWQRPGTVHRVARARSSA